MIKRLLSWITIAALGAVLAVAGFRLLFTLFMGYDDEGYVLLSLKNFSAHGGLYDRVYSQYGPFIYLLYDALHRVIGFDFTNTTGRLITLVNWLGTALICAVLVARQTRSLLWTAFTLAGVFTYIWIMIREPVHPGGLLALLVALGAWLGAESWDAGRPGRFAVVTALFGVVLAFTKINVGVFFLGAAVVWLALNTAPAQSARSLKWLVALGCALLPFVLMRTLLDQAWVRVFALIFVSGALAVLCAARDATRPLATFATWGWFAGALLGGAALFAGLTLARGTSLHGLVSGLLLEPLRHPGVYSFPMKWEPGAALLAVASLGTAAWAARSGALTRPSFRAGVAGARLVAGAFFLCVPLELLPMSPASWGMSYGVSLAWLFAVPLRDDDRGGALRLWLALVLVFQFLHAYPVPGSQANWGTFLWVPLLALGLHDATPLLRAWCGRWGLTAALAGATAVVGVAGTMTKHLADIGRANYGANPRLEIPGAENLRLDPESTYVLRILTENLRYHADLLFSLPGLYSGNLWTGLPTPTLANVTHWFSLLSEAQQQEIIERLRADPRAAIMVERDLVNYLVLHGFPPHGTLYQWLTANFEPALSLDGYELLVHRGRRIAVLSVARYRPLEADRRELSVTLAAPVRPVARIELCEYHAPDQPLATFTAENTDMTLTPIDASGAAMGAEQPATLPFTFTGLANITLRFRKADAKVPFGRSLIVLRDAAGGIVGEARVLD